MHTRLKLLSLQPCADLVLADRDAIADPIDDFARKQEQQESISPSASAMLLRPGCVKIPKYPSRQSAAWNLRGFLPLV